MALLATLMTALLLASGGAWAQDQLKVGAVYTGTVQLTRDSGGIILPLPDGAWTLVALEPSRSRGDANLATWSGAFVSTGRDGGKRLKGYISFYMAASDMFQGGWMVPELCNGNDLLHAVRTIARARKEIRCWGIRSYSMAVGQDTPQWFRDMVGWIETNTARVPAAVVGQSYVRASGPKYLVVTYFHNPEAAGFPVTGWTKAHVEADSKKAKYIEDLTVLGTALEPRVERGFAGKAP